MKITKLMNFSTLKLLIRDFFKVNGKIQPNLFHIKKVVNWLVYAQKVTDDGGVSKSYSLIYGWSASHPETSGYIIPTLFDYYYILNDSSIKVICREIADWLCSIQLNNGGFQGRTIDRNEKAVIFNTGQIIIGLIRAYKELHIIRYLNCAIVAGTFLIENQEFNGSWIKFCFENKSWGYDTRTAWALLELYSVTNNEIFKISAIKNLEYTTSQMDKNYWFGNNILGSENDSLLHFISYTIRGYLESGLILKNNDYIYIAFKTSEKLLNYFKINNCLPIRFNFNWKSNYNFNCPVGIAQTSIIWLKLYRIYHDKQYLENAIKLNRYLKSKQIINKKVKAIDGAIKGSDPIWGDYSRFEFPNWAAKFFCDTLILEEGMKCI